MKTALRKLQFYMLNLSCGFAAVVFFIMYRALDQN